MIREEQIDIRRQRAKTGRFLIENLSKKRVFSDYRITNPDSGGVYHVTIRGFSIGDNTCTCPDFKSNTLGTCKHIEAVLDTHKDDLPAHVQKKKAAVVQPQVYLHYGETLQIGMHLPPRHSDKLDQLAKRYLNEKLFWSGRGRFEDFIHAVDSVPEDVTVMSDAFDFMDREIERAEMLQKEKAWIEELNQEKLDLQLLTVPLYDYQTRGALFLACRGRSILGDDMGLGKTVQALAAIELLARERGISHVLVVAPASVKYQWETEIRKFTTRAVQVIEGDPDDRQDQYAEPTFYRLVNYEQVVRDQKAINEWKPDVIVLDEAQRIKNWESKTSKAVKKLQSRYAMVLTGTPLENKLEELYSIVQFVDERRFGPAFQFLEDHRVLDRIGNLVGYRNLDKIRELLEPIFLRRTRAEVLTQLPARTDNTVFVELSDPQRGPYEEQRMNLARLLGKGYITELDRKRILACIVNLRMICDSTFLFDKATNHSPKLKEFAELIPEMIFSGKEQGAPEHKLVVFSQWEQMILKAAEVVNRLKIGHTILHGGLSGRDRKAVLERFKSDPECRVFLSTDAGGTGLNLQMADTVINLELPWNPAVLEQRIARVHRMGQKKPVRVINLVTRGTIEERVLRTLEQKQNLFDGIFDGDEDEIAISSTSQTRFLEVIRDLLGEPRTEPAPSLAPISPNADSQLALWRAGSQMLQALNLLAQESGSNWSQSDPGLHQQVIAGLTQLMERLKPSEPPG